MAKYPIETKQLWGIFMDIFKHYKNGTTHITESGQYIGYEPTRSELILSIHIHTNEYNIHVYPDAVTITYKYIRVQSQYLTVGRRQYFIDTLQSYTGNEKKRLMHMYSVLSELFTEQRIGGEVIADLCTVQVFRTHAQRGGRKAASGITVQK